MVTGYNLIDCQNESLNKCTIKKFSPCILIIHILQALLKWITKGRIEMSLRHKSISRRNFVKISTAAAVSAQLYPVFAGTGNINSKSRIVRIHDSNATRPWDYSANAPWDHTVEPGDSGQPGKIEERYFDYINENIVAIMLDRGLRELTDTGSAADAWGKLLPNLQKGDRVTIKMNMNNASFDPKVTTNRMDQTMPLINVYWMTWSVNLDYQKRRSPYWMHPLVSP